MKKLFLLFGLLSLAYNHSRAQVVFYVQAPSPNEGNYPVLAYSEVADWPNMPDMTDPANAVIGNMVLVDDGTAADSTGCSPLVNGSEISGNIAVLYRGGCQYGTKALNAQNAGAIGVVVINTGNPPNGIGGGPDGQNVTIPVVMIDAASGATLRNEIDAGMTSAFIGTKTGYYGDDMGVFPYHVLRPYEFGNVSVLSQNASEFSVEMGGWVRNYGADIQHNVVLNASIDLGGSNLYNETSAPIATLAPGDSTYIHLPTFSATSYAAGYYDVVYTVSSDSIENFPSDNTTRADFMISDSLFSYCPIDESTYKPVVTTYMRIAGTTTSNTACLVFQDPNASKIFMNGLTFAGITDQTPPDDVPLTGQIVETQLYEWNDNFTGIGNATFTDLNLLTSGSYTYPANLQATPVYVAFDDLIILNDNQRYLVCAQHLGEEVSLGFDLELDYATNLDSLGNMPTYILEGDGTYYAYGFGTDRTPAITVNVSEFTIGVDENDMVQEAITPYPNPTTDYLMIPLSEDYGKVTLSIVDLSGKMLDQREIQTAGHLLKLDVTSLASGTYLFQMNYGTDNVSTFKVGINK